MYEIRCTTNNNNEFLKEDFELEQNEELLLEIMKDDIKFVNDTTCNSANSFNNSIC